MGRSFLSISPKTTTFPNPLMDKIEDPEVIRGIALDMESVLGSGQEMFLARPHVLYISSMLMDYADKLDREGYLSK